MKPIVIIDAYVEDSNQEKLLNEFIDSIYKIYPILLISNSKINWNIIEKVDYFIHDKKNNLFENEYDNYERFYLWGLVQEKYKLFTLIEHKQKHGLSVLINLFRALEFCKNEGYTHFHKIEYDSILGEKTKFDFINSFNQMNLLNKKLKVYLNKNSEVQSFQYFSGEINYFLNNFKKINNEHDYVNLINYEFKNNNFVIVEKLMYYLISKLNIDDLFIFNDLKYELNDSTWNQSASYSHLPKYYKDCFTDLYKVNDSEMVLMFTEFKNDKIKKRKIITHYSDHYKEYEYIFNYENLHFFEFIDYRVKTITIIDNDINIINFNIDEINNYVEIL